MSFKKLLALTSLMFCSMAAFAQSKPHVLMISVDGMKPEYATKADEHGLKVPTLRSFVADGTYAEGVQGVVPTVTYPSHTTLVTGVWPSEHGIVNNTTFDPMDQHPGEWYWYFNALKVETLYQVASKAGLTTAAVSWPATVGAPIDYLIAESAQSEETDTPQGPMVRPADLKEKLNIDFNFKAKGQDPSVFKDTKVTLWSVGIIERYQPNFMLVHISNLDHQEHSHGPFSPEANAAIEVIDAQLAEIIAAERKVDPKAKIVIVSDHGFVDVHHNVNVNALFVKEGLITLKTGKLPKHTPRVASWEASGWNSGGTVFVVLRDPNDAATFAKTKALLEKMKADPQYGVDSILTKEDLAKHGAVPTASFAIAFKPGWAAGGAFTGDVVVAKTGIGTHGYLPEFPALRSTFMAEGSGIAKHRDLKVIDMRQIAPSVAEMLGVKLSAAKQPPVRYKP